MTEETQVQDLVYALATSPNFAQDGICFAARPSGLYRSDDGGHTWHFTYDSLNLTQPLAATAVVVSPDFASDQSVFAGAPGGILHSVDGGQTWYVVMLTSPPPLVSTLVVSPNFAQDGMLLAGTMEDGVFRSSDQGSHWYPWNFGLLDLNILAMSISSNFIDDETLFVGTESGIFRSTNGGRAWREAGFPSEVAPVLSLALSPDYAHDGTLFAGTESHGLFSSHDKGRTWTRLGEEAIADTVNGIVLSPQFPTKPHILALLNDALLVSRDGGKSWSDWKPGLPVEQGAASVAAPQGLDAAAPLLVGLIEGGVLRV
jgi:photosystem II stability/assembly factor-like uncharacterized protein